MPFGGGILQSSNSDRYSDRTKELIHRFVRINLEVSEIPHPEDDDEPKTPDTKEESSTNQHQETDQAQKEEAATKPPPQPLPDEEEQEPPPPPKQVTQELIKRKSKRKRKRSRQEEIYTDKDRAAAVNMGNKDIKQSLKLKRREDRSKNMLIPEEAEPGTFLALGEYEMRRGDLHIALDFINKALELNPVDKNSLVARSKCYILLAQPEQGLRDAETALSIDKNFIKGIYQKAESLYYLGDFEHSLMYYHRGLRMRPEHEGFKMGVHKAQKAIENAIGSSVLLPGAASLSQQNTRRSNKTDEISNATAKSTPGKGTPEVARCKADPAKTRMTTSASRAKSAKKSRLLRELGVDKMYLENLINNPDLKCKYKEDDTAILGYIQDAVDFLNTRQEFWRQQLPPNLK